MSVNEKRKIKNKKLDQNVKKTHPRIEAIKVTVERKKECNEKALQIVTDFSEGTIAEDILLNNLKFINQEHYQDIVEERAINKSCGYPLCSKVLKNIPTKQYHISTTLNKVFDITERKNFCSNLCYKASKFLKDQVSTSPLWLREDDSTTTFTLISLKSRGGISGDEVDLGMSPVKLELEEPLPDSSTEQNKNTTLGDCSNNPYIQESNENFDDCNSSVSDQLEDVDKIKTNNLNPKIYSSNSNSTCENKLELVEEKDSNRQTNFIRLDQDRENLVNVISSEFSNSDKLTDHHNCQASEHTTKSNLNVSNPTAIKRENQTLDPLVRNNDTQTQNTITKTHKHSSKRKSSNIEKKNKVSGTNPIQNVVLKIEKILRDWISVDSLCFILGEEKIKEVLAEKKNQNLPAFTQDVHFYERYLAICKKLNVLELEDTKIDASYRDEARKPLPDYEALKEEARQMEIKVKMFYKGEKVQFEEPKQSEEIDTKRDIEPVLPLVDVHAQKALRRRIVIDKLRKVLQDLQKSLGLKGFTLTEDLRTLVSTFTLSAHNITMKPAEWNLVSIAVIKLLSLRDSLLAQALSSSTTSKHLTLLLMSYSLDSGYLDRLMVWLTDVEAVLQKT